MAVLGVLGGRANGVGHIPMDRQVVGRTDRPTARSIQLTYVLAETGRLPHAVGMSVQTQTFDIADGLNLCF